MLKIDLSHHHTINYIFKFTVLLQCLLVVGAVLVRLGQWQWHLSVRSGTRFDWIRGRGSAAVHVDSRLPSLHHLPPGPDGRTETYYLVTSRQDVYFILHGQIKAVNRAEQQTVQVRCLLYLTWPNQGRQQGRTTDCPGKMFTLPQLDTSRMLPGQDNRLSR